MVNPLRFALCQSRLRPDANVESSWGACWRLRRTLSTLLHAAKGGKPSAAGQPARNAVVVAHVRVFIPIYRQKPVAVLQVRPASIAQRAWRVPHLPVPPGLVFTNAVLFWTELGLVVPPGLILTGTFLLRATTGPSRTSRGTGLHSRRDRVCDARRRRGCSWRGWEWLKRFDSDRRLQPLVNCGRRPSPIRQRNVNS
jgi:hypothetical protein